MFIEQHLVLRWQEEEEKIRRMEELEKSSSKNSTASEIIIQHPPSPAIISQCPAENEVMPGMPISKSGGVEKLTTERQKLDNKDDESVEREGKQSKFFILTDSIGSGT
ncbi:uncharacterized protein LOC127291236 [Leptopilina boulardi]|uniref:uncharacterized protein LOC127291236 n=1 Tax=Leptopilina boulardi TaxID=63433 RepID=UPI0021F682B4|nr:uncharacterized protein LOC127291236 [Leptopilina boulardi]